MMDEPAENRGYREQISNVTRFFPVLHPGLVAEARGKEKTPTRRRRRAPIRRIAASISVTSKCAANNTPRAIVTNNSASTNRRDHDEALRAR